MNRQVANYIYLLLSFLIKHPFNLLSLAILTRVVGPEGMGQFAIIMAIGAFFHAVLLNWTQAPHVRFGREEWEKTNGITATWTSRLPLLAIGIVVAIVLLVLQPFGWQAKISNIPSQKWFLFFIYLLGLWITAEAQSLLQITGKIGKLSIASIIAAALTVIFYAILSSIKLRDLNVDVAIIGMSFILIAVWGIVCIQELFYTRLKWQTPSIKKMHEIVLYAWPLLPSFLFGYLSDWVDHFLLQTYFSSYEVGLFHVAYQVMLFLYGLSFPFTTILLPVLISKRITDTSSDAQYLSNTVPTLTVLWGVVIIPITAILPFLFNIVWGESFKDSSVALTILIAVVPSGIFSNLCGVLFNVQGRLGRVTTYIIIMTLLNGVISFSLIPLVGLAGAAIGTSISYYMSQFLYLFDQHRYLSIPISRNGILFAVLASFALAQALIGLNIYVRSLFALIYVYTLVKIVRRYSIVNDEVLEKVFSGRLSTVGTFFKYIFIKQTLRTTL